MYNYNRLQQLIESDKLSEATISGLLGMSTRTTPIKYPIKYKGVDLKRKIFNFMVGEYDCHIKFEEFSNMKKLKGSTSDIFEMALNGDVYIHCNCADFGFGGWAYLADELDYGLRPENRPPYINNPELDGSICKHLNQLLPKIGNYKDEIMKSIDAKLDKIKKEIKPKDIKKKEPIQVTTGRLFKKLFGKL